jgi:sterol desaturase/sphingolipid hydroxylase (fatty acid hydroxylase superfamily)
MDTLSSSLSSVAAILAGMALVALLEVAIPLRARGPWNRAHLAPNLALSFLTFATNFFFNAGFVVALAWNASAGLGLLHWIALPPPWGLLVAVLGLDLATYVAHVAMHRLPSLWRFHRVHHSDPALDVTTTLRQHPGEAVIRYAFLAAFALALGAGPTAFALYRVASVLFALPEHANLRVPGWLDDLLSLVVTFPGMHKVHHSRDARFTDTNYGNLVSWWDRLFATFTPARFGRDVAYGLDGLDDPAAQSTSALLALPFRGVRRAGPTEPRPRVAQPRTRTTRSMCSTASATESVTRKPPTSPSSAVPSRNRVREMKSSMPCQ